MKKFDESKRVRPMRAEVATLRQAKSATQAVSTRIEGWQINAVRLGALAQRHRPGGRTSLEQVKSEIELLAAEVDAEHEAFLTAVQQMPDEVANSGHVADTRNALASLTVVIRRALTSVPSS